jgi:hypothetical protein
VRAWLTRFPGCNWALLPGPSGFIVIDADDAEGEATLAAHELLAEPTLTVLTARGRHLFFRSPAGRIQGADLLGPKTTVRHWDGYTMLPPSVHPIGVRYRWAGRVEELRPLPAAAFMALMSRGATARPVAAMPTGSIAEGERNTVLTRMAGAMRRSAWSRRRSPPPS